MTFNRISVAAIIALTATLRLYFHLPLNDVINGALECCGGIFIGMSIRHLYEAKLVRGVSWAHVAFFSSWGAWNTYYYASLDQWFSWSGGIFLAATNSFWLAQIAYYTIKERRHVAV